MPDDLRSAAADLLDALNIDAMHGFSPSERVRKAGSALRLALSAPPPSLDTGAKREAVARHLFYLVHDDADPGDWEKFASDEHAGTPPCRVAGTCCACLCDRFRREADEVLPLLPARPDTAHPPPLQGDREKIVRARGLLAEIRAVVAFEFGEMGRKSEIMDPLRHCGRLADEALTLLPSPATEASK